MELKDTVKLMLSADFKEDFKLNMHRIKIEQKV